MKCPEKPVRERHVWAFVFFLGLALFLLRDALFSPGLLLGNDWGLPLTANQIKKSVEMFSSTWQFNDFLSYRNFNTSATSFFLIWKCFSFLGLTGDVLSKLFLGGCFLLAGFSLYLLLRFLGVGFFASVLGGTFYVTTPLFFNYTIMGWTFVLLSCGLMPLALLFFMKAVSTDDWFFVPIVAFLFSGAFLQSQSILWFPVLFFLLGPLLVRDLPTLKSFLMKMAGVLLLFALLNLPTFLPLLMSPDPSVSGSDLVASAPSLGTSARFTPGNVLFLFGGLFNYQFETILEGKGLWGLGVVYPLMALGGIFSERHKKPALFFLSISLVTFLMCFLVPHRGFLRHVPFSNLTRDFARFSVFSALGYSALGAIFLNDLFSSNFRRSKGWGMGLLFFWGVLMTPWWTHQLTQRDHAPNPDNRLRTKVFPEDYFRTEEWLLKKKLVSRALYLPVGGYLELLDGRKFQGPFQGAWDIFSVFSPWPGALSITDRKSVDPRFRDVVVKNLGKETVSRLVGGLRYIFIRKNMLELDSEAISDLRAETSKDWLVPVSSGTHLQAYGVRDFVPYLTVPRVVKLSTDPLESLPIEIENSSFFPSELIVKSLVAENLQKLPFDKNPTKRVVESKDSVASEKKWDLFSGGEWRAPLGFSSPVLEFRRIFPTKYRLKAHRAGAFFFLRFEEGYHPGWKLYPTKYRLSQGAPTLGNFRTIDGNQEEQASLSDLAVFLKEGWVTLFEAPAEKRFVSKVFHGTLQNDTLPAGRIWETWFQQPLLKEYHMEANASVNAWLIPSQALHDFFPETARRNADGTYDVELVIEFQPQKYFDMGLAGSVIFFFLCLGALFWLRMRRP